MSDLFLTHEETKTLTGSSRRKKQAEVLRQNRIPFFLNAAGWPVVTRSSIEGRESGSRKPAESRSWKPAVLNSS